MNATLPDNARFPPQVGFHGHVLPCLAGIKDKHVCMEGKHRSALWSSCSQMPKTLCKNSSSRWTCWQLDVDLASHGSNHLRRKAGLVS